MRLEIAGGWGNKHLLMIFAVCVVWEEGWPRGQDKNQNCGFVSCSATGMLVHVRQSLWAMLSKYFRAIINESLQRDGNLCIFFFFNLA